MKITIDISQIVYGTGVSRYTRELVKHLLKIDKENEYLLFAGAWRQRQKIEEFLSELKKEDLRFSSRIIFLPPKLADLIFNSWRIPIDRFIGQTDIFHASNWTTPKTEAKLVTTLHDLTPILFPETFPKSINNNFKQNLQLIEKTAAAVLADCQTTKNDLLEYSRINPNEIYPIYLGVDKIFQPTEDKNMIEKVKQKYGISGDYILSVGTKEPRKNIKALIDACQLLNSENVILVLVGKYGWGEKKLKIKNSKLKIIETGFVGENDLPVLYSGAKVFVYPSLYEGFGLPVLEAMACGCPVITADRSATAEIAGDAAILVNPTQIQAISRSLNELLENDKLRQGLINKGLNRAKQFYWGKTAQKTLEVYRNVFRINHHQ
ncbi:hypothetical protein A2160_02360 [Candidatus Beckwithbacteria bacterium RBG_13_42_9]|uniref:Glycosyl transferase family 1 domain-containing protein n=1 Tax=Candidatus Beckwithbacteria bacterium RBG_13_42_9 TaxID=1797457 RepID=A0A1F5E7D4_9BACT|nr:MAG: hypothetical protein A2160_02360 [Candidatus Beckwithbacteria bacterium RBG_13_42_9]